jgi:hypothetical protein
MNKKILKFICLLLLTSTYVWGQNWKWDTLLNDKSSLKLCKDHFNNVYSYGLGDTVLKKVTSQGQLMWIKSFPPNFHIQSMTCSPDSSVYVVGVFDNTLSLGTYSAVSTGTTDIFIARLSDNGNLLWLESLGSKGVDWVGDVCMNGTDIAFTGYGSDSMIVGGATISAPQKKVNVCGEVFQQWFA